MTDILKFPDIPRANDPATKRVHEGIRRIAQAIAVRAISQNHDVLFGVYCAGLYHGALLKADGQAK
jgi:hypothetical protein